MAEPNQDQELSHVGSENPEDDLEQEIEDYSQEIPQQVPNPNDPSQFLPPEILEFLKSDQGEGNAFKSFDRKLPDIQNIANQLNIQVQTLIQLLPKEEQDYIEKYNQVQQRSKMIPAPADVQEKVFDSLKGNLINKAEGGARLFHITDTHVEAPDLTKIIEQSFSLMDFNKDEDVLVHTGDLLVDVFNMEDLQRGRLENILPDKMADKGSLSGQEREEFLSAYRHILRTAGITEQNLLDGKVQGELLQKLISYVMGAQEPRFLSNDEITEYREQKDKFDRNFRTLAKNHARDMYTSFREVFDQFGLTPENMVLIEGNHDVPEVMQEVLGDYMINAGEKKNVKDVTFGNIITGSNGQMFGPHFGDLYGYRDIRDNMHKVRYGLQSFQELKDQVNEFSTLNVDDRELDDLLNLSMNRFSMGLGKGAVQTYVDKYMQPQLKEKVDTAKGLIATKVPDDVDIYLFHGQPDHEQHGGIEEFAAFEQVLKTGKPILHGHEHGDTTHKYRDTAVLNPGSGRGGNFGVYSLDKNREINNMFTSKRHQILDQLDAEHYNTAKSLRNFQEFQDGRGQGQGG